MLQDWWELIGISIHTYSDFSDVQLRKLHNIIYDLVMPMKDVRHKYCDSNDEQLALMGLHMEMRDKLEDMIKQGDLHRLGEQLDLQKLINR